jgi:hypothetical protein
MGRIELFCFCGSAGSGGLPVIGLDINRLDGRERDDSGVEH